MEVLIEKKNDKLNLEEENILKKNIKELWKLIENNLTIEKKKRNEIGLEEFSEVLEL